MCAYCSMCCVCYEKEENWTGLAHLLSKSEDIKLYEVIDVCKVDKCPCGVDWDAMCFECENFLCKHHWEEAIQSQPIINKHAIKECQSCTLFKIESKIK